ncbi:MAG: hypothetical protein HC880_03020 [Bacteroidia bacterium]|nr:hypothetical protein [Bacteroidia bacterium]
MANYLAQLSHVKDLFALQNLTRQTYFYQRLDHIPQFQGLFKMLPPGTTDEVTNLSLNYPQGLVRLTQTQDDFADRRNRMLDFLLAIHGENYLEYSLFHKDYLADRAEIAHYMVQNKSALLQYLPQISQYRARAFNYQEESLGNSNMSGLETKIRVLLGLYDDSSSQPEKNPSLMPLKIMATTASPNLN